MDRIQAVTLYKLKNSSNKTIYCRICDGFSSLQKRNSEGNHTDCPSFRNNYRKCVCRYEEFVSSSNLITFNKRCRVFSNECHIVIASPHTCDGIRYGCISPCTNCAYTILKQQKRKTDDILY